LKILVAGFILSIGLGLSSFVDAQDTDPTGVCGKPEKKFEITLEVLPPSSFSTNKVRYGCMYTSDGVLRLGEIGFFVFCPENESMIYPGFTLSSSSTSKPPSQILTGTAIFEGSNKKDIGTFSFWFTKNRQPLRLVLYAYCNK